MPVLHPMTATVFPERSALTTGGRTTLVVVEDMMFLPSIGIYENDWERGLYGFSPRRSILLLLKYCFSPARLPTVARLTFTVHPC